MKSKYTKLTQSQETMTIGPSEGATPSDFYPQFENQATAAPEKAVKFVKLAGRGKRKSRLNLTEKQTYNIAAKKFGAAGCSSWCRRLNPFHRNRYTKIMHAEQSYAINVRSAAKRLGLSKSQVRELAKSSDGLEAFRNEAIIRRKAIKNYSALINAYTLSRGTLIAEEVGEDTELRPKVLLKVIQQGLAITEHGQVEYLPTEIFLRQQHIRISQGGEISIVQEIVGEGNFGTVFRTFNLNKVQTEAMKQAYVEAHGAIDQLEMEEWILLHLRDGKRKMKLSGIQACPRQMTTIDTGKNRTVFYQTDLAQGNLCPDNPVMELFYQLPQELCLSLCGQLICGLAHTHKKHVVHGDIKPKNCLVGCEENGWPNRFMLADWGGAEMHSASKVGTASYRPGDYDFKTSSVLEGQSADVFALAMTLIYVLSGGQKPALETVFRKRYLKKRSITSCHPLPVKPTSPPSHTIRKKLRRRGLNDEVIDVLLWGLSPKEDRPTAIQFKVAYELATQTEASL